MLFTGVKSFKLLAPGNFLHRSPVGSNNERRGHSLEVRLDGLRRVSRKLLATILRSFLGSGCLKWKKLVLWCQDCSDGKAA